MAWKLLENGETHVPRDEETCSVACGTAELFSSPKYSNVWRQNLPAGLCRRDLLLSDLLMTLNSFCSLRALFCLPFFCLFFFLLLLIFSPHINYTDVLGAMCFATSQRKPQDFRSEELPDVLAWQNTTQGSQLRLPDQAGCLSKAGWGHHLFPEKGPQKKEAWCKRIARSGDWFLAVFVFFSPFGYCISYQDSLRSELPVCT